MIIQIAISQDSIFALNTEGEVFSYTSKATRLTPLDIKEPCQDIIYHNGLWALQNNHLVLIDEKTLTHKQSLPLKENAIRLKLKDSFLMVLSKKTLQVFEWKKAWTAIQTIEHNLKDVQDLDLSPDHKTALIVHESKIVSFYDVATGEFQRNFKRADIKHSSARFSKETPYFYYTRKWKGAEKLKYTKNSRAELFSINSMYDCSQLEVDSHQNVLGFTTVNQTLYILETQSKKVIFAFQPDAAGESKQSKITVSKPGKFQKLSGSFCKMIKRPEFDISPLIGTIYFNPSKQSCLVGGINNTLYICHYKTGAITCITDDGITSVQDKIIQSQNTETVLAYGVIGKNFGVLTANGTLNEYNQDSFEVQSRSIAVENTLKKPPVLTFANLYATQNTLVYLNENKLELFDLKTLKPTKSIALSQKSTPRSKCRSGILSEKTFYFSTGADILKQDIESEKLTKININICNEEFKPKSEKLYKVNSKQYIAAGRTKYNKVSLGQDELYRLFDREKNTKTDFGIGYISFSASVDGLSFVADRNRVSWEIWEANSLEKGPLLVFSDDKATEYYGNIQVVLKQELIIANGLKTGMIYVWDFSGNLVQKIYGSPFASLIVSADGKWVMTYFHSQAIMQYQIKPNSKHKSYPPLKVYKRGDFTYEPPELIPPEVQKRDPDAPQQQEFQGRTLSEWVTRLDSQDDIERTQAAWAISRFGKEIQSVLPKLIAILENQDSYLELLRRTISCVAALKDDVSGLDFDFAPGLLKVLASDDKYNSVYVFESYYIAQCLTLKRQQELIKTLLNQKESKPTDFACEFILKRGLLEAELVADLEPILNNKRSTRLKKKAEKCIKLLN